MKKIVITGLGCVSAIGNNVQETLSSLRQSRSGLAHAEYLDSKYASLLFFGEVKKSKTELIELLSIKQADHYTRTDLLASIAFDQAINDAELNSGIISSRDTAFISASTVGGMCETDSLYQDANAESVKTPYLSSYACSAHTLLIAGKYKMQGITDTINTACSSSANAIMYGARLIQSGRANRVIVGGVDSLAKYTVNGFNALTILSDSQCKPFDEHRNGLNLGEAAAYLVLESEEAAGSKKQYAVLSGYGNTNDAFHPSSMSDNAVGVTTAIEQALSVASLHSAEIDYINAHGTGTQNNDIVELTGFKNVFKTIPPFNSTKSYTGHTLGAAGSLEAVITILSIHCSELYASLNMSNPIAPYNIKPVLSYQKDVSISHAMSNSYGFSGSCTSLIFSKS